MDDLMIFDDFEAETGQAAFPFFWERDYSKLNL